MVPFLPCFWYILLTCLCIRLYTLAYIHGWLYIYTHTLRYVFACGLSSCKAKDLQGSIVPAVPVCCAALRLAMLSVLRLREHGLGILAPVCGSFTFLCKSQSGRCFEDPRGRHQHYPWVQTGNKIAARILEQNLACFFLWPKETPARGRNLQVCVPLIYIYIYIGYTYSTYKYDCSNPSFSLLSFIHIGGSLGPYM